MSATSDNARRTCTACRGTGKLISGLGGVSHEVTCPWCGGSGEFQRFLVHEFRRPWDRTDDTPLKTERDDAGGGVYL